MVASVTRLKVAASTVHYFEADGYYARNDPEHRKASGWHGSLTGELGLRGPVQAQRFESVLAGFVPGNRTRLGRLRDGEHQHRPGVDVTFSAPKSVSLEALVYARPKTGARVVRAHDEAVRATLDFIEEELLQTRGYDPATGRRPRVRGHGLAAATFRHVASRSLDPQLHTHAVIANMTRNEAGEWRSAEFTALERSKLLIGTYYRNELRTRLEAMGYATEPTLVGRVPGFEIARLRASASGSVLDPSAGSPGLHGGAGLGEHAGTHAAGGALHAAAEGRTRAKSTVGNVAGAGKGDRPGAGP